jgi:sterol 3beta-glucosyltransferase
MKILITTFGTRGDLQPYIAFALGLQAANHTVAVCTSEGYRSFVESYGLQYEYLDRELLELTQLLMGEAETIKEIMSATRKMPPLMRQMMEEEWNTAHRFQPDLIIYHAKCLGSLHVAEKLGIPAILSLPLPFYTPTTAFPVPFMANVRLGNRFNKWSYGLMEKAPLLMYGNMINDFRVKTLAVPSLGRFPNLLARSDGSPVPVIYPYSAHVLPVPDDFPPHVYVTGYWFLDRPAEWQPDPDLVRFLEAGPPPVYIGYGSMGGQGAHKRTKVVIEALERSGQRGLISTGWGGLQVSSVPDNIYKLDTVPHDWLFPQVAAVVHHGGSGTTASGLRAGKPTVICPFVGDQPFWGRLVHQLGVGPKPISQKRLTADRLAEAITLATQDVEMQKRANELGQKISAEDGVARAVEIVSKIARGVTQPSN